MSESELSPKSAWAATPAMVVPTNHRVCKALSSSPKVHEHTGFRCTDCAPSLFQARTGRSIAILSCFGTVRFSFRCGPLILLLVTKRATSTPSAFSFAISLCKAVRFDDFPSSNIGISTTARWAWANSCNGGVTVDRRCWVVYVPIRLAANAELSTLWYGREAITARRKSLGNCCFASSMLPDCGPATPDRRFLLRLGSLSTDVV